MSMQEACRMTSFGATPHPGVDAPAIWSRFAGRRDHVAVVSWVGTTPAALGHTSCVLVGPPAVAWYGPGKQKRLPTRPPGCYPGKEGRGSCPPGGRRWDGSHRREPGRPEPRKCMPKAVVLVGVEVRRRNLLVRYSGPVDPCEVVCEVSLSGQYGQYRAPNKYNT